MIFVVIPLKDKKKVSKKLQKKKKVVSGEERRGEERTGATESEEHCGVSGDRLKHLIKLCYGSISLTVFRTYLLLGRLSGQVQG